MKNPGLGVGVVADLGVEVVIDIERVPHSPDGGEAGYRADKGGFLFGRLGGGVGWEWWLKGGWFGPSVEPGGLRCQMRMPAFWHGPRVCLP